MYPGPTPTPHHTNGLLLLIRALGPPNIYSLQSAGGWGRNKGTKGWSQEVVIQCQESPGGPLGPETWKRSRVTEQTTTTPYLTANDEEAAMQAGRAVQLGKALVRDRGPRKRFPGGSQGWW